jgi:hypothetical protein
MTSTEIKDFFEAEEALCKIVNEIRILEERERELNNELVDVKLNLRDAKLRQDVARKAFDTRAKVVHPNLPQGY